jgi:5-methylcytosine-specific restriction endonuclease McrA
MHIAPTLPSVDGSENKIWLETTSLEHGHGGSDIWAFGRALWSPSHDVRGNDYYALMRQVKKGDLILHLLKGGGGQLVGHSYAADSVQDILTPPPNPGDWGGRPSYYRIPVRDYTEIDPPLSIKGALRENKDEFKAILESGINHIFYCQYRDNLQLNQGKYLTQVPPSLYRVLRGLTPDEGDTEFPAGSGEFREGSERKYVQTRFERDPRAREEAIARYKRQCMVCEFDFNAFYGPDYSVGYIEVHHTKPLSSLRGERVTKIEDLVLLCSNCHRVIHRKRKEMLDWKELRAEVSRRRKKILE